MKQVIFFIYNETNKRLFYSEYFMTSINKTIHKLNEGNKMKPESITNFQVFIYLQIILPLTG